MKLRLRISAVVLALTPIVGMSSPAVTTAPADKQQSDKLDSGNINKEPLSGLVINRTMTVLGWDFYKSFTEIWRALHPDSKTNLTVVERPTAQFGSEIWINYDNQTVFHTFLSPARSRARDESKQAVKIVYDNVVDIEVRRKFIKDADLGPEEM